MDIRLRRAVAGLILVVVVIGLMASVRAQPNLYGDVNDCDGNPIEGATVVIKNLSNGAQKTYLTDVNGRYWAVSLSPNPGDHLRITATYGDLSSTQRVVMPVGVLKVDFTLCPEVPALAPVGLIALLGLLSAIAAVAIVRKRR
jgi:hypothetical protein